MVWAEVGTYPIEETIDATGLSSLTVSLIVDNCQFQILWPITMFMVIGEDGSTHEWGLIMQ